MGKFMCCIGLNVENKKKKVDKESSGLVEINKARRTLKIRLEHPVKPLESGELKTTSISVSVDSVHSGKDSQSVKKRGHDSLGGDEAPEIAYEGEDEHEENASMKRELSDFDLQHYNSGSGTEITPGSPRFKHGNVIDVTVNEQSANKAQKDNKTGIDENQAGHASDPGIGKAEFLGSPNLKRSCSNVERSYMLKKVPDRLTPLKFQYSWESLELNEKLRDPDSPRSITSHCSADRVMLKKHSSRQVLPSRSRKIWWKLFLWSHRNLHRRQIAKPKPQVVTALGQQSGYHSDTVEPNRENSLRNMQSPGSFTGESLTKGSNNIEDDNQSWDGFHHEVSGLWNQKQWVAFPIEPSPFARVDEWVKELETQAPSTHACDDNDAGAASEGIMFPPTLENGKSPGRSMANLSRRPDAHLPEEILHANAVIQSLNYSSTVAHISGIGLNAMPTISCFTSLRSVNLSNNFIVYISPGSLPKCLHTLDLSKNKISSIEGLRELTRLRMLNLSYNRISRIGQGLSNCTMIKELYLAGNKISDAEGLHRLLKLTVLDLCFNKITTTKALGQLVANYNSLQALNLLGNPILNNISDEQLRKAVCGLLTKLVYLNKQPIKPQRAREVLTDSVAKAALGTSRSFNTHRKALKKGASGVSSASCSTHRSSVGAKQKNRGRSKSRNHHLKTVSSLPAASTSR